MVAAVMTGSRWSVLGLARANATWFHTLSRWATAAILPVDFARCVSIDEVRARLSTGRAWSALVAGGDVAGVDRDLIAQSRRAGAVVVIVDDGPERPWRDLGAAAVVGTDVDPEALVEVLAEHARAVGGPRLPEADRSVEVPARGEPGALVAVTGPGGTGATICAMALAQGWVQRSAPVTLIDLCRRADLAMYHDTVQLVPGLQELAEAFRHGAPAAADLASLQRVVADRGYRLVPGLRRARHWVTIRPDTLAATIEGVRRSAAMTVVDVDPEIEGASETGSTDIEERHALSRVPLRMADVVLVVIEPSVKGVHAGVRLIDELVAIGIDVRRLQPVLNAAETSPRRRHVFASAIQRLSERSAPTFRPGLRRPVVLPRRDVDAAVRDARPLPPPLSRLVSSAVADVLSAVGASPKVRVVEPERIVAGSLGFASDRAVGGPG